MIEQAKGVLAEFGQVDMESAFSAMRFFARGSNRQLSAVAMAVTQRELDPSEILGAERAARPRKR